MHELSHQHTVVIEGWFCLKKIFFWLYQEVLFAILLSKLAERRDEAAICLEKSKAEN